MSSSPARPKVFIIGFSKTATTTLHKFFAANGCRSVHWDLDDGRFLAGVITTNVQSGRPILASIDDYEVYSELSYAGGTVYLEANCYFKELHAAYPDAYFILNVRDTESWIASRAKHVGRNKKGRGSLMERIALAYGTDTETAKEIWRDYHEPFHAQVTGYFAGHPDARFHVYDIAEHGPDDLASWLARDYQLDPNLWVARNVTTEVQAAARRRKNPINRWTAKLRR